MPCATQNDVNLESAKLIANSGARYYIEVANMPTTNEALGYLMSQNSMRYSWTAEKVDAKLHAIMKNIHDNSAKAAKENGLGYNLVAGANIAGFAKVADAMIAQGSSNRLRTPASRRKRVFFCSEQTR
jgi:glutamate dehydrogenase (NADP+)